MGLIDLDAARAARLEAQGKSRAGFVFGGETFHLPAELPLIIDDTVEQAKNEKWPDSRFLKVYLQHMLGAEQWQRFLHLGATQPDLVELFDKTMENYGASTGESGPSASSSRRTGGSSKRKSAATTKKTPART